MAIKVSLSKSTDMHSTDAHSAENKGTISASDTTASATATAAAKVLIAKHEETLLLERGGEELAKRFELAATESIEANKEHARIIALCARHHGARESEDPFKGDGKEIAELIEEKTETMTTAIEERARVSALCARAHAAWGPEDPSKRTPEQEKKRQEVIEAYANAIPVECPIQ